MSQHAPVVFDKDISIMKVGELIRKNYIICPVSQSIGQLFEITTSPQINYVLVVNGLIVEKVFSAVELFRNRTLLDEVLLGDIQGSLDFAVISEEVDIMSLPKADCDLIVVVDEQSQPVGIIDNIKMIIRICQQCGLSAIQGNIEYHELKNIVHYIEEEIFVTDGEGKILFLNPAAETVCGFKKEDVIGKHVTDLEKEHLISSSISMIVLKTREKVHILQSLKTEKTVLGTAIPIFNEQGEINRVICTSKDVNEINNLMHKIERQKKEIAVKDQELNIMREALFGQNNFVCFSKNLEEIKETLLKIALTDLTILIQGESGVGKEVAVRLVHSLSARNKKTLVKINCGMIPENLIESELFGYESGAFTGANKNGKIGKIELADQGTLFLDEIGEMPLLLQVKLLEFLQDREITRIGGTKRIGINVRIVAATNRNLKDMMQQGKFREDLYYRLNVFPLRIPPLRERKEDIKTFGEYFLQKFNDKYKLDKKLAPDALDALNKYEWPGNVREFEHVMERAIVSSNSDFITTTDLDISPDLKQKNYGKVICTGLLPWKVAKKELEEQLIKRAYNVYKSTYKAAEALDVSQSTVVKVLKKYK